MPNGQLARMHELQRAMLPRVPAVSGWSFAFAYQPRFEVCGDLCDLLLLGSGRVGLALADVSGDAVPAAFVMARLSGLLRGQAAREEPDCVLEALGSELLSLGRAGCYVTMLYAIVDTTSGVMKIGNAGHRPALKRSSSGGVEAIGFERVGAPLGLASQLPYRVATTRIEPGEVVLFYNDGLAEAPGWSRGRRPGAQLRSVFATGSRRPDHLVVELREAARANDDVTILGVGRDG